jgi:hypothetical protein
MACIAGLLMGSVGHSDMQTKALDRELMGSVKRLHTQIWELDRQIKELAIVRDSADNHT